MKKILFFIVLSLALSGCSPGDRGANLYPVDSFSHGHGLAVDRADQSRLLIATHEGLYLLQNEKDLYQIGEKKDDYMGFSLHPTQPGVFFTSGHPEYGGNLGFQKSENGGATWQKVSAGANGPVDFHAMTVSPANPNLIYGWYGGLQRSLDQGQTWAILENDLQNVIQLVADPMDENKVYATTAQGLMMSEDKGMSWSKSSEIDSGSPFLALAIHPKEPNRMLSFSVTEGLVKSEDAGKSWKKVEQNLSEEFIFHIAYDPHNPQMVYLLTKTSRLMKSADGGASWFVIDF